MRNYVIRRLLLVVPIAIGVSLITFATFSIIPGDAIALRCGFACDEEQKKEIREKLGLNRPKYEQYADWLAGIPQGDFGKSLSEGQLTVAKELEHRLPITLELMVMTIFLSLLFGIPAGIFSAIRPGTPLDWIARFTSVLWLSIPSFYLGILLITAGAIWFNWTPPQFAIAYVPFFDDPWVNLQEFFFPSLVLAVGSGAVFMRLTRSSMLEVLRNDYIRTAWSKGLRERSVVWRHALKNSLIPVVTLAGLQIGALLEGAVIIESLYNLNGIGKYTLEAIIRRDIFVVQTLTLFFALTHVGANLAVDVAYAWLDPRIHYG
jgi:peptide/nickel transport system permease protein